MSDQPAGSAASDELDEMGPVDYVLVEWADGGPTGEAIPHLLDLVDRGLIRILDLALMMKGEDGTISEIEISELGGELAIFEGVSAGLLDDEDLAEAGQALEAGRAAALLIYENRWAAPFASAVRRSGAQLVASGRIPVQALAESLDATENRA